MTDDRKEKQTRVGDDPSWQSWNSGSRGWSDSTQGLQDAASSNALNLPGGGRIGPYRILTPLGRGGMGAVWRAEAAESCAVPVGKYIALKLLHRVSPEERRRAAREVAYLQALHHPGVVRVLDFGEHLGRPWIVMDLVDGRRLDKVMSDEGPFASDRAARIAVGALEALHVAHLAGILHRDIKPGNLMLRENGQVVVLDFGLAAAPEFESRLTASDTVIGTPAYMSPEQAAGQRTAVSPRSDIYAMGAVLYEMVSGTPPFSADDPRALLRQVIEQPLTPPSQHRPGMPRDLETIILRAMAKDPRDRYRFAEAMAADLRRFMEGRQVKTTRPGRMLPFLRTCWRRRRTLAGAGLLLFIVLAGSALAGREAMHRLGSRTTVVRAPGPSTNETWMIKLIHVQPLVPPGDISGSGAALHSKPRQSLGLGFYYTELPKLSGPVRLEATVTPLLPFFDALFMISDRDIGKGYTARLVGTNKDTRIELLRGGKVMTGRDLGRALMLSRPQRLKFHRHEDTLEIHLLDGVTGTDAVVSFVDLVPLEGPDASGTYIAADPAAIQIAEVTLETQRQELAWSDLLQADMYRQDGRYELAKDRYEDFLREHTINPPPQARDAMLRAGLCYEEIGKEVGKKDNLTTALAYFNKVAQTDIPRYHLVATFHAWACLIKLARFEEADQAFAILSKTYSTEQLLDNVPKDAAEQLVEDYVLRAQQVAATDQNRAIALLKSGAEAALFVKQPERVAMALSTAGDLYMALDSAAAALSLYQQVVDDPATPLAWRSKARMKQAEALCLSGKRSEALAAYREVAEDPQSPELSPWAWLWLGDLLARGNDFQEAIAAWSQAALDQGLAGRYARTFLGNEALPSEAPVESWYKNDFYYMCARLADQSGDHAAYIDLLRKAATAGAAGDWPSPLARQLLLK
ncbi:MAG: serine/threonine-protein kinase [Planctomycetota bacterium]